jgi:hypothetical protein
MNKLKSLSWVGNRVGKLDGVNKKGLRISSKPLNFLAGSTGLEPAASGVTGRRYNRLNYDPAPDVGRRNRI